LFYVDIEINTLVIVIHFYLRKSGNHHSDLSAKDMSKTTQCLLWGFAGVRWNIW